MTSFIFMTGIVLCDFALRQIWTGQAEEPKLWYLYCVCIFRPEADIGRTGAEAGVADSACV